MWETIGMYLKVFFVGGALCALGQLLILKTRLTPARILVGYVTAGVVLGAVGVYQPRAAWAGAGATSPLTGFGKSWGQGAINAVRERGLLGAVRGGLTQTGAGVAAASVLGYLAAIVFRPKMKA